MIEPRHRDRLQQNWQRLQQEVAESAAKHGRQADEITIVAVTKYVDLDTTRALLEAGCKDLGESRPQSLWEKSEAFESESLSVSWHLIGHLQRNKVRRTVRQQPVIHSIDSERLLNAVAAEAVDQGLELPVLLEVNISGDAAKTGFEPEQLAELLSKLPTQGVRILGLMAMAGRGTSSGEAERQFTQVRELRDRLTEETGHPLAELSMGMSGDFPAAIAAGATMIRVGSRLYEGLGA